MQFVADVRYAQGVIKSKISCDVPAVILSHRRKFLSIALPAVAPNPLRFSFFFV